MKKKFNVRVREWKLDEVEGTEWKNPFGLHIFIHRGLSGSGKFTATEYSTGLLLHSSDKLKDLKADLSKKLSDPYMMRVAQENIAKVLAEHGEANPS